MGNKNILIIETNKENLKVLNELLEVNNYNVISACSEDELSCIDVIDELHLTLVNSSVTFLSPKDIYDLLQSTFHESPPLIYLDNSKKYKTELLLECYKIGVVDYIKKPFELKEIVCKIDLHTNQFAKLNKYKSRVEKLANLATVDQLSNFSSKMHMQAILKHQIKLSQRHTNELSILYLRLLDTDRFVGAFGYEYGEKFIASFAKELKKSMRESDVIARWCGSDFMILLLYTNEKISSSIAKKIMSKLHPVEIMPNVRPSIAIGITELENEDTIQSIVSRSKKAMFKASKLQFERIQRN